MKLEKEIQREILDFMNRQHDLFAWRNDSVGIFSEGRFRKKTGFSIKGTSDILGIHKPSGKLVAVEVKSEKGKASMEQKAFINKINAMNGLAIVVKSLDEFREFLEEIRSNYGLGGQYAD